MIICSIVGKKLADELSRDIYGLFCDFAGVVIVILVLMSLPIYQVQNSQRFLIDALTFRRIILLVGPLFLGLAFSSIFLTWRERARRRRVDTRRNDWLTS